jgi:hypothetical protein
MNICRAEDQYKAHLLKRLATRAVLCVDATSRLSPVFCVSTDESSDLVTEAPHPEQAADVADLGPVVPLKKEPMPKKFESI